MSTGSRQPQQVGVSQATQTQEPWSALRNPLANIYSAAESLRQGPQPGFYPGQTFTQLAPETQTGLDYATQFAGMGAMPGAAAVGPGAQDLALQTMQGGFLPTAPGFNPWLDAIYNQATRGITRQFQESIAPGIAGQATAAGRYGSGLYQNLQSRAQDELGRTLSETAARVYGPVYEAERARQQQAMQMAPGLMQLDLARINELYRAGARREQFAEAQLADAIGRFEAGQTEPFRRLGAYASFIQGAIPGGAGTTRTTQPIYQQGGNPLLAGLGGGLAGAGAGSAFGPLGAGIGGLAGLGLGLFA